MKNKALIISTLTVIVLVMTVFFSPVDAQCAMCKGAAEANLKQGGGDPRGLNNGILYMLAMPYLLVGCIGYWWWRNRKKDQQAGDLTEGDFVEE
jgi:hypothetical protein